MRTRRPASDSQSDGILRAYEERALVVAALCSSQPPLRPPRRPPGRSFPAGRSAASGSARPRPRCAPRSGTLRRLPRLRDDDVVLHLPAVHAEGLAVELTRGRVSAVYTSGSPRVARAGGPAARRGRGAGTTLAGPLVPLVCSGYDALTRDTARCGRRTTSSTASSGDSGCCARTRTRAGDRARRRAGGRAPARRRRPPHARLHLAHARRAGRRVGAPQGGVLPARRRVQVPRRVQQDRVAAGGRRGAASSPTRPATTRRRSRSPRGCSARTRRS